MCLSDPIRTGGIHKSNFTGPVFACVRKWMSWFVYLCALGGTCMVAWMCMRVTRSAGICVLLSAQTRLFSCSFTCYVVLSRACACVPFCCPWPSACVDLFPIMDHCIQRCQSPHEFLIHCICSCSHTWESHFHSGWVHCVCVFNSQGLGRVRSIACNGVETQKGYLSLCFLEKVCVVASPVLQGLPAANSS